MAIAVSMETAARDALELQKKGVDSGIHKMSMFDAKGQEKKCYRCGKTSHDANDCWLKDKNCRKCNRTGHIERVCRQKSSSKQAQREKSNQDKKLNIDTTSLHVKVDKHQSQMDKWTGLLRATQHN